MLSMHSSSIRKTLPTKSVHDTEKEHDHDHVIGHDDVSVEGPSRMSGKQLNGYICSHFQDMLI